MQAREKVVAKVANRVPGGGEEGKIQEDAVQRSSGMSYAALRRAMLKRGGGRAGIRPKSHAGAVGITSVMAPEASRRRLLTALEGNGGDIAAPRKHPVCPTHAQRPQVGAVEAYLLPRNASSLVAATGDPNIVVPSDPNPKTVFHQAASYRYIAPPSGTQCGMYVDRKRPMPDFDEDYDPEAFPWLCLWRLPLDTAIETDFRGWMKERKAAWRGKWNVSTASSLFSLSEVVFSDDDIDENRVPIDFWTRQGFPTFEYWLASSTARWKRSYSWNHAKRRKLKAECEEEVHFPSSCEGDGNAKVLNEQVMAWIRVRKRQWQVLRRKRQRRRTEEEAAASVLWKTRMIDAPALLEKSMTAKKCKKRIRRGRGCREWGSTVTTSVEELNVAACAALSPNVEAEKFAPPLSPTPPPPTNQRCTSTDDALIDAMLEEREWEEREELEARIRPLLDISFIFDASLGAPDDVVAHCLSFLHRSEHGKLLCISWTTSHSMKQREEVWRSLCPTLWILPRRPRKPWHAIYVTKIREEEEQARKRSDEVLLKASNIVSKSV